MKTAYYLLIVLGLMLTSEAFAQPYSLDEKIQPVKLELKEDKKVEGASSVVANVTLNEGTQFFYVTGCNMFQMIDVFIFSNFGSPNFKIDLVKDTWGDVHQSGSTGSADKGIVNFKLRAEGDFGLKVYPGDKKINYTIVVYASSPIQEYLGDMFKDADESELKEGGSASADNSNSSSDGGSSNMLLYIGLGVALLVIGFLAAKLLSKNKAATLLILLGMISYVPTYAQTDALGNPFDLETYDADDIRDLRYREEIRERAGEMFDGAGDAVDEGLDRLGHVGDMIRDDERYKRVRDLYDSYVGLGSCISSTPPPGMPRVPSFCRTAECGSCFTEARRALNQNRYTFERLKTIYNCTKKFTDAAIAFGDNVSGVHGVSGLAWQSERVGIMKSIEKLQKTYDNKYRDLLQAQKRALMDINDCEAQHGIEDWYDRFGYMFYEFTAMNYKRPD